MFCIFNNNFFCVKIFRGEILTNFYYRNLYQVLPFPKFGPDVEAFMVMWLFSLMMLLARSLVQYNFRVMSFPTLRSISTIRPVILNQDTIKSFWQFPILEFSMNLLALCEAKGGPPNCNKGRVRRIANQPSMRNTALVQSYKFVIVIIIYYLSLSTTFCPRFFHNFSLKNER